MDTDWLGRAFLSPTAWDHLERLVDSGPRLAGTDVERAAAEATRDALADAGARDARLSEFDVQGWERGTTALNAGGTDHDCIALPRSPDGDAEGALLDLGHGLPEDFAETDCEGRVVMVSSTVPEWHPRRIHRREKYYRAVEAGATAFVFRGHLDGGLAPTGSVGTEDAPLGEIPAVGVSKEVGLRLARRHAGEEVTVAVDCETPAATSQNVRASLGPDTEERVLVTSHVDAHDISEGAMDNGAGTAAVVGIAEALADRESDLETGVEFVCFGSEEVGLVGSERYAERVDHDSVRAVINVDGVCQGRTLRLDCNESEPLVGAAETVSERLRTPMTVTPELSTHSDHWSLVQWGVPGYHVYSDAHDGGRGWGHTRADTLDKLDRRDLRSAVITLTDLTVEVARADREIAHRDPADVAASLEAQGMDAGMKVTGDWPYSE
jgi:Zn-dependent M28 family amino/carboxypeptidase